MISQISRQGFSTRQACAGAAALLLAWAAGGCSSNTPDVPADAAADAAVDASLDVPFDSGPVVADADSDVDTGPDIQFPDIPIDVPPQVGLWTQIIVPGLNNIALRGVWADATSRVYAVGTGGSVVGYDGLQWQVLTTGKFSSLNGITGTPGAKNAFAVGMQGIVLQAHATADNTLGKKFATAGGCSKPADCEDSDPCTVDVCEGGACVYSASATTGCCGGAVFADSFDKGLGKWLVTDAFTGSDGGIVWTAAHMIGKDGKARFTSPQNSAYFGRTDVPCADDPKQKCATFDNGKVVGSTMTSPQFSIPKAKTAQLSFQLSMEVASGFTDQLQIMVVGPAGTEVVWDKQKNLSAATTFGKFKVQTVDLTKFGGQSIHLAIVFNSLNQFDNAGEGVFIDDLLISTTCAPPSVSGKGITDATLFGVWAADDLHAWTVGEGGVVGSWNGESWKLDQSPTVNSLRAIKGFAADNVWAVGDLGTIVHNDSTSWQPVPIEPYGDPKKPSKVTSNLLAIWGAAPDDIWASGEPDDHGKGVLVHWDGTTWTYQSKFADETRIVRAIWGWSKDRILFVGTQGMAMMWDGNPSSYDNWEPLNPGTIATLFSICPYGKDALIVGDIGTVLRFTPLGN